MSGSGADRPPAGINAEERARLRPGVDIAALERFLARTPEAAVRRAILLHFAREVTVEDARAVLADAEDVDAISDLDRAMTEPLPTALSQSVWEPGKVSHRVKGEWVQISVLPPEDPELRALWEAIEPARPNGAPPPPDAA